MSDEAKRCPHCDSTYIVEEMWDTEVCYGLGPFVWLKCREPVMECQSCGQAWTDERGEQAREATVRDYLATLEGK